MCGAPGERGRPWAHCRATGWILKGPDAQLFDLQNRPVGKHYAGPTWEGLDGGKLVGEVKTSMPAPVDKAVPWLLLNAKSHEGSGGFTQARAIVRMGTTGGTAPGDGCDKARAGRELRIPARRVAGAGIDLHARRRHHAKDRQFVRIERGGHLDHAILGAGMVRGGQQKGSGRDIAVTRAKLTKILNMIIGHSYFGRHGRRRKMTAPRYRFQLSVIALRL